MLDGFVATIVLSMVSIGAVGLFMYHFMTTTEVDLDYDDYV